MQLVTTLATHFFFYLTLTDSSGILDFQTTLIWSRCEYAWDI